MEEAKTRRTKKHRDRIGVRRARFEQHWPEKERKNISPPVERFTKLQTPWVSGGASSFTANSNKRSFAMLLINRSSVMRALHLRTQGLQQRFALVDGTLYIHDNCLGCKHYHRKCKIVAACCNVPFTCRFCHDDNSDHVMDRYNTKEMQCMICELIQPITKNCKNCNIEMAQYFCKVCNLFDDLQDGKSIYHCPFCNVCRKGKGLGQDFFHCMKCNSCVSLVMGPHECHGKKSSMESECPVCKEFMFDSETPLKTLPCGHLMHTSCFETYTRHYYTCPLCRKSLGDFTVYFKCRLF